MPNHSEHVRTHTLVHVLRYKEHDSTEIDTSFSRVSFSLEQGDHYLTYTRLYIRYPYCSVIDHLQYIIMMRKFIYIYTKYLKFQVIKICTADIKFLKREKNSYNFRYICTHIYINIYNVSEHDRSDISTRMLNNAST